MRGEGRCGRGWRLFPFHYLALLCSALLCKRGTFALETVGLGRLRSSIDLLNASPTLTRRDGTSSLTVTPLYKLDRRQWISCFVMHSLKKIDRVNYGLLRGAQLSAEAGNFFEDAKKKQEAADDEDVDPGPSVPASRLLLAVPFKGLEQPSESAEFAHPDVAIGLTILAYRHEGLRPCDLRVVIVKLKAKMQNNSGPIEKRAEFVLWKDWTENAIEVAERHGKSVLAVDPLDSFMVDNLTSFESAFALFQHFNPVIDHYLRLHVFPEVMRCQELKISSSGQCLGSSLLFQVCLCLNLVSLLFSFAPNAVGPIQHLSGSPTLHERALIAPGHRRHSERLHPVLCVWPHHGVLLCTDPFVSLFSRASRSVVRLPTSFRRRRARKHRSSPASSRRARRGRSWTR